MSSRGPYKWYLHDNEARERPSLYVGLPGGISIGPRVYVQLEDWIACGRRPGCSSGNSLAALLLHEMGHVYNEPWKCFPQ